MYHHTKNNVRTHVHLHTLNHAGIATATCVRNTTTLNQHIYTHAFTHMCVFTDSLVRRAGSDLGTWRPGAGRYLVTLPQDHPGASHCHQAIVVWAAPTSLELTENWVRGREVFLGRGHVTSSGGGGASSHRRGEDSSSTLPCRTLYRLAASG